MKLEIRRFLLLLLVITAMVFSLCACQDGTENKSSTRSGLPELKIGVNRIQPFFYKDVNGDYTGIDTDIATEACRRAGYRPVFVEIPMGERDQALQNGQVDCLWHTFSEREKEHQYVWTDEYLENRIGILVGENCPDKSLKELKSNGGIAVVAGSRTEKILLRKIHNSKLIQQKIYSCGTFELAETAFIKGYAGALAADQTVLLHIMNDYPGEYRILDDELESGGFRIAFRKEADKTNFQKINEAIREMKQDGTILKIRKNYDPDIAAGEVNTDDTN